MVRWLNDNLEKKLGSVSILFELIFWDVGAGVKKKIVKVQQPRYSPDLAPCKFFLFPKVKIPLTDKIWGWEDIER